MRGESFALSTRAGRLGARSDRIRGMGDGKYFYFYFPDLPAGTTTTTNVSVACAPVASVLDIAFGSSHPHTVLSRSSIREPGVCNPGWRERRLISISDAPYQGYLDVHYNGALERYVMFTSADTHFANAESIDGLTGQFPHYLESTAMFTRSCLILLPSGWATTPAYWVRPSTFTTRICRENGNLPRKGDSLRRLAVACP